MVAEKMERTLPSTFHSNSYLPAIWKQDGANLCHTPVMSAQISKQPNKLQQWPKQQPPQATQAANFKLGARSLQRLLKRRRHTTHVSILSQMQCQQLEEIRPQSQEFWCLSALVEKQQEVLKNRLTPGVL